MKKQKDIPVETNRTNVELKKKNKYTDFSNKTELSHIYYCS